MKILSLLVLVMVALAAGCGGYNSGNGMKPGTPAIAMLTPDSASAGGTSFMLTVGGTGFAGNSVIYWNSASMTTTFVSAEQVTAEIPASEVDRAGSASVFVKNPGTGVYANGVDSNTVTFTIH